MPLTNRELEEIERLLRPRPPNELNPSLAEYSPWNPSGMPIRPDWPDAFEARTAAEVRRIQQVARRRAPNRLLSSINLTPPALDYQGPTQRQLSTTRAHQQRAQRAQGLKIKELRMNNILIGDEADVEGPRRMRRRQVSSVPPLPSTANNFNLAGFPTLEELQEMNVRQELNNHAHATNAYNLMTERNNERLHQVLTRSFLRWRPVEGNSR